MESLRVCSYNMDACCECYSKELVFKNYGQQYLAQGVALDNLAAGFRPWPEDIQCEEMRNIIAFFSIMFGA